MRLAQEPCPGWRTLKNLLVTALQPVGSTMYIYGGGWNEMDTGAGREACSLGCDPRWRRFFEEQNPAYDEREHRYCLGCGLDCSGYLGWTLYNTLEAEKGKTGYVMSAAEMASSFACRGWGVYRGAEKVTEHLPGDIMSSPGHVWLSLGTCSDGSVLLLHASPPGVMISGTVTPGNRKNSEAITVASALMKNYAPEWYGKFPQCSRGISYLREYAQMSWFLDGSGILTDPDGYGKINIKEVLRDLFHGKGGV